MSTESSAEAPTQALTETTPKTVPFVHLRVHSEYSLIDGLVRVKPLVKNVAQMGMPAVAITDHCNLFSLVKFQTSAMSAGIKPIYGADIYIKDDEAEDAHLLTLLVRDHKGYHNLTEIISKAYLEGQRLGRPQVKREWLNEFCEGLIALSGAQSGEIGKALLNDEPDRARALLDEYQSWFPGCFYLEVQRTGRARETEYLRAIVPFSEETACPLVATNDVRFIKPEDFEAHEVRVCIHDGRTLDDPRRPRRYTESQYLRSPEEMCELFSDIPQALQNTVEIAKRCNEVVPLGTYYLPQYPVPAGMTMDEFFVQESQKGLEERLQFLFSEEQREIKRPEYEERLKEELDVILQMGFPGYFLIVMDFIKWAKDNDVPVGPGRGSGAGSLVAYALKITDLDPIEYDLLFERFLNPERVSMPDFDVDFCMDGRDRVIDYVAENYGRDAVSQIITYGSMAAKAVVRDVGRVHGLSYGFVDSVAKLIPFELGMTLEKALEQEEQLQTRYDREDDVRELIDMALKLEGITRNVGKHAGGVVIAPSKLTDYVPLYCDESGGNLVTQFDKDDVESAGLVKFDFLGLRTLTIVDWALQTVNEQRKLEGEPLLDIASIPLDDRPSFDLLQRAETTAVFQLESRGMKDLIKRLKPSVFEDIIALVALFRPGPLQSGMVDDFINRKHGRAKVEYPHPSLEPILNNTYGVIVYQEQVMQIAQILAGYTLGGADILRRAMGKKKAEEMAKQREIFTSGALAQEVPEQQATQIFDTMEKFAAYGFNKSHSAAYALVSYQTLWLKCHYPSAFMAAVLSSDMHNTDKVVIFIEECRNMGLTLLSPDVNYSEFKFTVNKDDAVVYGLGAIKGVGEGPIESIVEARANGGEFKDLFDFCKRVDLRKLNKRTMEALIRSGALDNLGSNRATLMATLGDAIQVAEQHAKNEEHGMMDLFGTVTTGEDGEDNQYKERREWSDEERLSGEKDTLGLYLTGHPIDQFESELREFRHAKLVDLKPTSRDAKAVIAGLIVAMRIMKNKRGDRMCFITLDDRSSRLEVSIFADVFQEMRDKILKDQVVVVEGDISVDDFSGGLKMVARRLMDMTEARDHYAKEVKVSLTDTALKPEFTSTLKSMLEEYPGTCPIAIQYRVPGAQGRLDLGDNWCVSPKDHLLERLRELCRDDAQARVEVMY